MSRAARIDGRPVEVRAGETVLAAARRLGIDVPTLCFEEGLPPQGGCRVCLVEVAGRRRPQAACHTPLEPGMEVRTESPRLAELRRDVLALSLSRGELGRFLADPGGSEVERLLARLGREGAGTGPLFGESAWRARGRPLEGPTAGAQDARATAVDGACREGVDHSHPYLRFDPGLCIVCRRCEQACEAVQGQFVYGVAGRGGEVRLLFGPGARFAESACVACGACVDRCPSGALTDRDREDGTLPEALTDSVCGYCGVGCRVRIATVGGRVLSIAGVPEAAVNRGHLCAKGRYAHLWQASPERLDRPLLRTAAGFEPLSWPEAIAWLALRLRDIHGRFGPDALAVMTSSRSTNEAAYLLQKLFRTALGTNHVDCCARVCHASTALALQRATGTGAATASYADLERARLLVVAGANPTEAHPVVGARLKQAVLAGARLLVIDPRRIELADYADLHLQLRPGTNVALFNALAKALVERGGADRAYLDERAQGVEEYLGFLAGLSLAEEAETAGVSEGAIRAAADLLAEGPALFVHGLGLSEQSQGTASVLALTNLGMLSGSIGRPGAGMLPLRGQNNVQGNADMGSMPGQATGYQSLADPEVRRRLGTAWGKEPPATPGLTVTEMLDAAGRGRIRALWIQGEDVAQSDPNQGHVLAGLDALELLVVQEIFLSETARRAHLVLPAASVFEQDGTFTNGERRIQRVRAALPPPGEARPDWEVVLEVARALGEEWSYAGPGEVWEEISRVAPALFGGVSYERLEGDGLQWPCPTPDHPGTATVHASGFLRGRGRLTAMRWEPPPEHALPGYPFRLITGRVLQHYNVGTQTRRTPSRELAAADELEIHPEDLRRLGLGAGERVRVESRWGAAEVAARASLRVAPGTLFLSFHFPETHANRLVGPHVDPESKCPDYKVVAVRLAPAVESAP